MTEIIKTLPVKQKSQTKGSKKKPFVEPNAQCRILSLRNVV